MLFIQHELAVMDKRIVGRSSRKIDSYAETENRLSTILSSMWTDKAALTEISAEVRSKDRGFRYC